MVDGTDSFASCNSGLHEVIAAYLEAEAQGPTPTGRSCWTAIQP